MAQYSDGTITVPMEPPVDVSGWSVKLTVAKRFVSANPIATRYAASGYGAGQSGVEVLDSGQGIFRITLPTPEEMSGLPAGNLAFQLERTDSGARGPLWQGYGSYSPSIRQ